MDDFLKGYLVAAFWSENCDDGSPIISKYDISDITPESLKIAELECNQFQTANNTLLAQYYQQYTPKEGYTVKACAGHDFWLTRNGHGVGFWDRGLGELGERLSEAARAFPSRDVMEVDPEHGKGLTIE